MLFSTCFGQLCAHHQEKIPYRCDTWYLSMYIDDKYAGRNETTSALNTRTGVYRYDIFSWWWAHICQKHFVKSNKLNKKRFARICVYLQRWKSGHDVGSKSIDIKHITVNVLNYRWWTDFVHFWIVGDVKMKFVTRCQEHMANWFFLNSQQAAVIARALNFLSILGQPVS